MATRQQLEDLIRQYQTSMDSNQRYYQSIMDDPGSDDELAELRRVYQAFAQRQAAYLAELRDLEARERAEVEQRARAEAQARAAAEAQTAKEKEKAAAQAQAQTAKARPTVPTHAAPYAPTPQPTPPEPRKPRKVRVQPSEAVMELEGWLARQSGIKWRVLIVEGVGRALAITEGNVASMPFHDSGTDVPWELSTLREWLNGTFLNSVLAGSIRAVIVAVKNTNPPNPYTGTSGGGRTEDRVFLLSIGEAEEYFESDYDRQNGNTWWLRSPGLGPSTAAFVLNGGRLMAEGNSYMGSFHTSTFHGVRPAIWVPLDAPASAPATAAAISDNTSTAMPSPVGDAGPTVPSPAVVGADDSPSSAPVPVPPTPPAPTVSPRATSPVFSRACPHCKELFWVRVKRCPTCLVALEEGIANSRWAELEYWLRQESGYRWRALQSTSALPEGRYRTHSRGGRSGLLVIAAQPVAQRPFVDLYAWLQGPFFAGLPAAVRAAAWDGHARERPRVGLLTVRQAEELTCDNRVRSVYFTGRGWWLTGLLTPFHAFYNSNSAAFVKDNGVVISSTHSTKTTRGVRPVLLLDDGALPKEIRLR